jgi:hypothetical protein
MPVNQRAIVARDGSDIDPSFHAKGVMKSHQDFQEPSTWTLLLPPLSKIKSRAPQAYVKKSVFSKASTT